MNITSYMLKQETPSKETEGKAPESLPFLMPETPVETPTVLESGGPVKEATCSQGQAQPPVKEATSSQGQAQPAVKEATSLQGQAQPAVKEATSSQGQAQPVGQAAADNAAEAETQQLPDLPAAALGSQTQQVPAEDLEDVLGKLMAEEDLEDCLHCKIYICACTATPISIYIISIYNILHIIIITYT